MNRACALQPLSDCISYCPFSGIIAYYSAFLFMTNATAAEKLPLGLFVWIPALDPLIPLFYIKTYRKLAKKLFGCPSRQATNKSSGKSNSDIQLKPLCEN